MELPARDVNDGVGDPGRLLTSSDPAPNEFVREALPMAAARSIKATGKILRSEYGQADQTARVIAKHPNVTFYRILPDLIKIARILLRARDNTALSFDDEPE